MINSDSTRDNFTISTDKQRLHVDVIHSFLSTSYWATNVPRAVVERSIENSLCFGVFQDSAQIGFARVINDYATFAYLADVFILEPYRGQGLSKWLLKTILDYPDLQGLRRWLLATKDAHGLYQQFGFEPLSEPRNFRQIVNPNVYSV
ncbi:MAG: GNAT family N-acetyltransferase [Chloroflexota bacterium]